MLLNALKGGNIVTRKALDFKIVSRCYAASNLHSVRSDERKLVFSNVKNFTKSCVNVYSTNNYEQYQNSERNNAYIRFLALAFGLVGVGWYNKNSFLYCDDRKQPEKEETVVEAGKLNEKLPTYTESDLRKHNKEADRVWVSYKNGVYDITDFVQSHPGGNKILLGAGSSIEPFWDIYQVHHKNEVYEILEKLRIGNLKVELSSQAAANDAFKNDPKRSPLIKVVSQKPFNGEAPRSLNAEHLITPNELHFKRNHLPVPVVDVKTYRLEIENVINGKKVSIKLGDLKTKFPIHTIPVTLQCSGNRRKGMHEYEHVQGLMWEENAISTAEWTGVKLRDLLAHYGIDMNDSRIHYVNFEGLDTDPAGAPYVASIPKEKAFSELGDVLIAFKMNGVDLPPDHGYPVRVVVPGVVGARSIKWLSKIVVSDEESKSHWQVNDYKVLPPSIKTLKGVDFTKYKAVQESPVTSAICEPYEGEVIKKDGEAITIKGFAYSGGGRSIDAVQISLDGGKSWTNATLKQFDRPVYRSWAWAIWEIEVPIPKDKESVEIICVARDSEQNSQPESPKAIWNVRGILNNSWHRIKVKLQ